MSTLRRFALPFAVCALTALTAVWGFTVIPAGARVATHWDASGHVNGYSSRTFALLFPVALSVGVTLLLAYLPRLDPRRRNVEASAKAIVAVSAGVNVLLLALLIVSIRSATGHHVDVSRVVTVAVGALFVVLGNYLTKVRSNFFVGIRTPWTLSSDEVWRRTHRAGGRLFAAVGLLAIVVGLIAPAAGVVVIAIGAIAVAVFSFAYSYAVWHQQQTP